MERYEKRGPSGKLAEFNAGVGRLMLLEERDRCESSFIEFVRHAWPIIDIAEFREGWAIQAMCEHLQAVTEGKIRRLLINLPPRCGKSIITSICWPSWTWTRMRNVARTSGPQTRFLCSSYSYDLSLTHSTETRRLLMSEWYQERWPHVELVTDQNAKARFENSLGGVRIATSVGGLLLGVGGDVLIADDPHNVEDVLSAAERVTTASWWKEFSTLRMNDPKESAIVVNMQRLDQEDVSGTILHDDKNSGDWCHLMIPMEHDPWRHCVTVLGWSDPRGEANELMWPERFGVDEVERIKRTIGPYLYSGRCQQDPRPVGGGIIRDEWWQDWPHEKYPQCEFILASLDPAYTEKELNDPSALTIWGTFRDTKGNPKIMLMYAWQGRLEIADLVSVVSTMCTTAKLPAKTMADVLKLANSFDLPMTMVPRFSVDRLLIESKASGISVAQELRRLYGNLGQFAIELVDPSKWGDKITRLYAVQHMFADEMIYAPDRAFADLVINQVGMFPKGADDLVDTVSLALRWLRLTGVVATREEYGRDAAERLQYKSKSAFLPLY